MQPGAVWIIGLALGFVLFLVNPVHNAASNNDIHPTKQLHIARMIGGLEYWGHHCSAVPRPGKVVYAFDSGQVAIVSFEKARKAHGKVIVYCGR